MLRRRAVAGRLALIALGLLLALIALEALLQIAARFVSVESPAAVWLSGSRRVICVGDSNTYGLAVERDEAYPQVLQRLWNAGDESPTIEVLNLGVPGMSSSVLRNRFQRLLRVFAPNVVLFMVGANDGWTIPAPLVADEDEREPQPLGYALWQKSRVFRLLYMVSRAFEAHDVDVTFAPAADSPIGRSTVRFEGNEVDFTFSGKGDPQIEWKVALQENLVAMAAAARAAGAAVAFVTYPSDEVFYGHANTVIVRAAAAAGVPLIDVAAAFRHACPGHACPDLLRADQHPTARGYEVTAETIKQELRLLPLSD